jgi:hypothetical protein
MAKAVAFILAFLYLGVTTGLAVNIHYCMGKVSAVKFQDYDDKDACKTKMPCCQHNYQLIKVSDEHEQIAKDISVKAPVVEPQIFDHFIAELFSSLPQQKITQANSPPLLTIPDICIQNCVFRI